METHRTKEQPIQEAVIQRLNDSLSRPDVYVIEFGGTTSIGCQWMTAQCVKQQLKQSDDAVLFIGPAIDYGGMLQLLPHLKFAGTARWHVNETIVTSGSVSWLRTPHALRCVTAYKQEWKHAFNTRRKVVLDTLGTGLLYPPLATLVCDYMPKFPFQLVVVNLDNGNSGLPMQVQKDRSKWHLLMTLAPHHLWVNSPYHALAELDKPIEEHVIRFSRDGKCHVRMWPRQRPRERKALDVAPPRPESRLNQSMVDVAETASV